MPEITASAPIANRPMPAKSSTHILSVQSHVCRDYVGNRAAATTLQLLGRDVDVINTVSFSSMYIHEGSVLSAAEFKRLLGGLWKAMSFKTGAGVVGAELGEVTFAKHDLTVAMSGFMGSTELLNAFITEVVDRLLPMKADHEAACPLLTGGRPILIVIDPVMGDNGQLYVEFGLPAAYQSAIGRADIITPNECELRWLTPNIPSPDGVDSHIIVKDLLTRISHCHSRGVQVVFLTSAALPQCPEALLVVFSIKPLSSLLVCKLERLPTYVGGCGDVLNALLVDRLLQKKPSTAEDFAHILGDVLATMKALLCESVRAGWTSLEVVKCRDILESPGQHCEVQTANYCPDALEHLTDWVVARLN